MAAQRISAVRRCAPAVAFTLASFWLMPATVHPQAVAPLQGTFMQLSVGQRWTDARLNELFLDFKRLRLSTIVVQWAAVGDHAFYSSKALEPVAEPPLEAILRLADESGMSVRIGLAHDPEFWDRIKVAEPLDRVQAYLQLLRMRSLRVARELAPLVSGHRSFDGWFVTEEVDDVNWIQPERRALLRSHLRDLSNALGELAPRKSVAISGFSNAHSDPATLEAFWLELLDGIRVDLVLFQDGIGAHKLTLDSAGPYLRAMKRATTRSARALSIVVELFEQIAGPPVSSGPFKAVSTGVDRLTRQLALAGESSTAGVVAFSVPDYMARGAGPSALQLFTEYATLVAGGSSGQDQELWSGRPTEK